jgi:hypothetical protein
MEKNKGGDGETFKECVIVASMAVFCPIETTM